MLWASPAIDVVGIDNSPPLADLRDAGEDAAADETPSPPCDAQPEEIDIALIVDRFETAARFPVRAITHKWAGLRSFVADKTPVVGMAGDADGFLWLTGQGGCGIMTSPAMGSAAASLIQTGALPGHFARFGLTEDALAPRRLTAQCSP